MRKRGGTPDLRFLISNSGAATGKRNSKKAKANSPSEEYFGVLPHCLCVHRIEPRLWDDQEPMSAAENKKMIKRGMRIAASPGV